MKAETKKNKAIRKTALSTVKAGLVSNILARFKPLGGSFFLALVVAVACLAGVGFYMKSLRLHTQVDNLQVQNDKLAAELEKMLMSNQWLTLQNAAVQEDKEILHISKF